jgi:hypothetical protein
MACSARPEASFAVSAGNPLPAVAQAGLVRLDQGYRFPQSCCRSILLARRDAHHKRSE